MVVRRSVLLYIVSMIAMWSLLIPLALYMDGVVNRPICADTPNAALKGRVAATYVDGDRFYVYLAKDNPPQISTEPLPLNMSEWKLVQLTEGGIVDVCISEETAQK